MNKLRLWGAATLTVLAASGLLSACGDGEFEANEGVIPPENPAITPEDPVIPPASITIGENLSAKVADRVMFSDDFEGSSALMENNQANGNAIEFCTINSRSGHQSTRLTLVPGVMGYGACWQSLPIQERQVISLEFSFLTNDPDPTSAVYLQVWMSDGEVEGQGDIWIYGDGKIYALDTAGEEVYVGELGENLDAGFAQSEFHSVKLVFDFTTFSYLSVSIDDLSWDTSNIKGYSEASTADPIFNFVIGAKSGTVAGDFWLDDVIVTRAEN
jgi:hypothetical protein